MGLKCRRSTAKKKVMIYRYLGRYRSWLCSEKPGGEQAIIKVPSLKGSAGRSLPARWIINLEDVLDQKRLRDDYAYRLCRRRTNKRAVAGHEFD